MDISKENSDPRSELHGSELHGSEFQEFSRTNRIGDANQPQVKQPKPSFQTRSSQAIDKAIKMSAVSFDSCDADELMHCYQIAIDFGVPTAQRALAMYQSKAMLKGEN